MPFGRRHHWSRCSADNINCDLVEEVVFYIQYNISNLFIYIFIYRWLTLVKPGVYIYVDLDIQELNTFACAFSLRRQPCVVCVVCSTTILYRRTRPSSFAHCAPVTTHSLGKAAINSTSADTVRRALRWMRGYMEIVLLSVSHRRAGIKCVTIIDMNAVALFIYTSIYVRWNSARGWPFIAPFVVGT